MRILIIMNYAQSLASFGRKLAERLSHDHEVVFSVLKGPNDECLAKLFRDGLPNVKVFGHQTAPMVFAQKMVESKGNPFILPWTRRTNVNACKRAGLDVDVIDVIERYDCFTSSEYVAVSASSITEPGKKYEAVRDGRIAFDGSVPMNPSGSFIGCGHPVGEERPDVLGHCEESRWYGRYAPNQMEWWPAAYCRNAKHWRHCHDGLCVCR